MNFKPIGKRVLLKRSKKETKTQSGIYLPNNDTNNKQSLGNVVAISDQVEKEFDFIKMGSLVAFKEYKASEIQLNNEEFLVVEIDDILGIIL